MSVCVFRRQVSGVSVCVCVRQVQKLELFRGEKREKDEI